MAQALHLLAGTRRRCRPKAEDQMKRIVSLTPGTKGWIVTLECGHTRHFYSYPSASQARCWVCPAEAEAQKTGAK